jgi:poly(3-hydroxybutyrate) depolymerase
MTSLEKVLDKYGQLWDMTAKYNSPPAFYPPGRDPYLSEHHKMTRVYYANDLKNASLLPLNSFSQAAQQALTHPLSLMKHSPFKSLSQANAQVSERMTHTYKKPNFDIPFVTAENGTHYVITEKIVAQKPFCNLIHFQRQSDDALATNTTKPLAKVLIVAPYSGHYATLLRDTVKSMLADHDVYITDWDNARDVPLNRGEFSLDSYIDYLIDFLKVINDDVHILAVCQPAVPVLALSAILNATDKDLAPKSMILMGGPIDTRINPTKVNTLSRQKDLEWFDRNIISYVPHYYPGAWRRVVAGFLMLAGFMSLNLDIHISAPSKLFQHLIRGDYDSAEAHNKFYNEYRAVLDLPADYFLDSVFHAFLNHSLPCGTFTWHGQLVDPKAITQTALMTVEGEKDDISGVGQTHAAHDICAHIPPDRRAHYVQPGVGHYGVFNGSKWRTAIYPQIRTFIDQVRD